MMPPLLALLSHYVFSTLMVIAAVFLILLVMVQRGRGGGLAGAFGGLGGQSAFGAKAGDLFTRITMVAATIWILLCMLAIKLLNSEASSKFATGGARATISAPATEGQGEEGTASDQGGAAPLGAGEGAAAGGGTAESPAQPPASGGQEPAP